MGRVRQTALRVIGAVPRPTAHREQCARDIHRAVSPLCLCSLDIDGLSSGPCRVVGSKPKRATSRTSETARIVLWFTPNSAASARRLLVAESIRMADSSAGVSFWARPAYRTPQPHRRRRERGRRPGIPTRRGATSSSTRLRPASLPPLQHGRGIPVATDGVPQGRSPSGASRLDRSSRQDFRAREPASGPSSRHRLR